MRPLGRSTQAVLWGVIWGVGHLVVSSFTWIIAVIGLQGLAMGGHAKPGFWVWQGLSLVLCSPVVTGLLFAAPDAVNWHSGWVWLLLVGNSVIWVLIGGIVVRAIRRRRAAAA